MSNVNAKKPLTLAMIERLEPGQKTPTDSITPGLYAACNSDRSRSWRYLRKAKGSVIQRTYGTTREFNLVEARAWAAEINRQIACGENPNEARAAVERDLEAEAAARAIEDARKANTLRRVWESYMATIEGKQAAKTIQMKRCRMNLDVLPVIGDKPITDVTLRDLHGITKAKLDKGLDSASNHLVADLKAFFNWCISSRGMDIANMGEISPAANLKKDGEEGERTRFFDLPELPILVRAIADQDDLARRFFTLILLTGQRLDNVLTAEYSQWQPAIGAWVITNMKGEKGKRVPNVLPLGKWGASLFAGGEGRWLFPSIRGEGPRQGHIRAMMDKLLASMARHAPDGFTIEHARAHDFRRTFTSTGDRLGFEDKHVEACVGHKEGGIRKHYQMYKRLPEKRAVLNGIEDELIRIAVEEGVAATLGIPTAKTVVLSLAA